MSQCPNINGCRLVNGKLDDIDSQQIKTYLDLYCTNSNHINCKRYQFKLREGFCPDFITPDTTDTLNMLLEKFDSEC